MENRLQCPQKMIRIFWLKWLRFRPLCIDQASRSILFRTCINHHVSKTLLNISFQYIDKKILSSRLLGHEKLLSRPSHLRHLTATDGRLMPTFLTLFASYAAIKTVLSAHQILQKSCNMPMQNDDRRYDRLCSLLPSSAGYWPVHLVRKYHVIYSEKRKSLSFPHATLISTSIQSDLPNLAMHHVKNACGHTCQNFIPPFMFTLCNGVSKPCVLRSRPQRLQPSSQLSRALPIFPQFNRSGPRYRKELAC